ncbi:MAG: hypothetical protein HUN05_09955 [Desulfobacter sp.]|nr:MAG: hypothetical protein HUN05_09955 [Desulfobacter sp.]
MERQHGQGKMTVRERIDLLIDSGTFKETGVMAGVATYTNNNQDLEEITPCPVVIGRGKINGQKVIVQGDDFTIRGASVGRLFKAKLAYNGKMAHEMRLPLVRLLDGAGGTIREVADIGYLELPVVNDVAMGMLADLMSEIPMVSVALGPVSGIGALLAVESHFSIMVKEKSQVFVGGPPLVQWAQGQKVSKEELGGYRIHTRGSGVIDNEAESEEDAIEQAKQFLDYLPSNVWEMPERKYQDKDDPERREEELLSIIPKNGKKTYDMRRILECI